MIPVRENSTVSESTFKGQEESPEDYTANYYITTERTDINTLH